MTGRKVGSLHVHKLPDARQVGRYDVYRCECNKEFFMNLAGAGNEPDWFTLDSTPHYVEYNEGEVNAGAPRVGRWSPQNVAEGVVNEQSMDHSAEQTSEGGGNSGEETSPQDIS